MFVFAFLFALVLRYVNGLNSFLSASLTAYGPRLVVDWYDFTVVDMLLAPFDMFYRLAGVSAFNREAVRFHFVHSLYGIALGLPAAAVAGLLVTLL